MIQRISLAFTISCLFILALAAPDFSQANENQNYKLAGTMQRALDPQNPDNEVISSRLDVSDPDALFAVASRKLLVKIAQLDNQVQTKYFFVTPRNCNGGSPRIQLAIDIDGDGRSDGNAFGYIGPAFSFTPCTQDEWKFEDLTDAQNRWELSQFFGANGFCTTHPGVCPAQPTPFVIPWDAMEAFFTAIPTHKVLTGALVDDTFGAVGQAGTAYYDNLTIGKRTLDGWEDTTANK